MTTPHRQAGTELFRALGHPVRIRVLELLRGGPMPVRHLLTAIPIDGSRLARQLAILRGAGLVTVCRDGDTVRYSLGCEAVAELLETARQVLTQRAVSQQELLVELWGECAS